eukprot:m.102610 g.102610  ORF g.102610 m.102610 type:complete len:343 (-) comp20824_c0_seq1:1235-2263(-)
MSEQGPRPRVAPAPTPAWPVVGDASLLDVSVEEDDGGSATTMGSTSERRGIAPTTAKASAASRPGVVISHHRSADGVCYTVEREPGHAAALATLAAAATTARVPGGSIADPSRSQFNQRGATATERARSDTASNSGTSNPRRSRLPVAAVPSLSAGAGLGRPEPLSSVVIQQRLAELGPHNVVDPHALLDTTGTEPHRATTLTGGARYSRLVSIVGESNPTGNVTTGSRARNTIDTTASTMSSSSPDRPPKPRRARALHPARQSAPRLTGRTLESQIAAVPVVDIMSRFNASSQRDTFVKCRSYDAGSSQPAELGSDAAFRATQQLLGWNPPMLLRPPGTQS